MTAKKNKEETEKFRQELKRMEELRRARAREKANDSTDSLPAGIHPFLKMTHEKQKAETEKLRKELERMEELRRAREREGEGRLNSRDN